jgi:ketosteroid isomerase-like protein
MYRLLTTLALATIAIPDLAHGQCSDADRKALEAFDRAWGEATTRGDRAHLQTAYADDYMDLSLGGQLGKAQAIDDAVRQAERNRANPANVPKVTYGHYIITCTPTTATITHRNEVTSTVGGKEQTTYSRSVHVVEKRGGRWQVISNAGHPLNDAGVLLYMEREWNDAEVRRDAGWLERNLANDATIVYSATPQTARSKAEAVDALRTGKEVFESIELSDVNVRVDGDAAVVTGINRVRGRDAQGRPMDFRVRFTDAFVKRDGRWLVWAAQASRIP